MKIGIVVDNYKVSTYQKRLEKERFVYESHPWKQDLTSIIVKSDDPSAKDKVESICTELENYFFALRN